MESTPTPEKKFEHPSEEIAFLREQIRKKEEALRERNEQKPFEENAQEVIRAYSALPDTAVLKEESIVSPDDQKAIVLALSPEPHDSIIEELLGLIEEKGIKTALSVVEEMKNPHVADDLHRFLIQYIQFHQNQEEIPNNIKGALSHVLFQLEFPVDSTENTLEQAMLRMEQLYVALLSLGDGSKFAKENYYSIEVALEEHEERVKFYIAVPRRKKALLEKQLGAVFPRVRAREHGDDYNVFVENGAYTVLKASSGKDAAFPLLVRNDGEDPMKLLLSSFQKVKKDGEGLALQIVVFPSGETVQKKYAQALEQIKKGVSWKDAVSSPSLSKDLAKGIGAALFGTKKEEKEKKIDEQAIRMIGEKLSRTLVETNIRIVSSAETKERAEELGRDMSAVFKQFDNAEGNSIVFSAVPQKELLSATKLFSYRLFNAEESIPLNVRELSGVFHFGGISNMPHVSSTKGASAPPPLEISSEGAVLGVNRYLGNDAYIRMSPEDRLRHTYVIGQTGTGKTTLLKNMIIQDIEAGHGVCMIDPHGSDIQDVLGAIPLSRKEDVIYFDPSAPTAMGLNMLEYDPRFPDQKSFVVNELLSIFNKLFDMKTAGGPIFEQYFRNATMLVIEDPASGNTLLEVSRVLADKEFREKKLLLCKNPLVVQFWRDIAGKAGGEASLQNIVPYVTSKFDVFLSNDIMRPIVAQETSAFNFRKVMDERKILLVNLSKGRLGDINAHLLGLILVGKILMASLSRADSFGAKLPPFYLYIDEFQNVTTDSIATILSEARKYGLSLTIAHQYIAQLSDSIKNAVFGNVGSLVTFRVGADDAKYLENQFAPTFSSNDIMNLDNRHAYVKMLLHGKPVTPFDIETLAPKKGTDSQVEEMKKYGLRFGRNREEVEQEIAVKYTRA